MPEKVKIMPGSFPGVPQPGRLVYICHSKTDCCFFPAPKCLTNKC